MDIVGDESSALMMLNSAVPLSMSEKKFGVRVGSCGVKTYIHYKVQ